MDKVNEKISESIANLNYLKDKSFIECVNDLIKKDVLVFYEQVPHIKAVSDVDSYKLTVCSGILLTTTPRIQRLESDLNSERTARLEAESKIKVLAARLEKCKEQRNDFAKGDRSYSDKDINKLDQELEQITEGTIK